MESSVEVGEQFRSEKPMLTPTPDCVRSALTMEDWRKVHDGHHVLSVYLDGGVHFGGYCKTCQTLYVDEFVIQEGYINPC